MNQAHARRPMPEEEPGRAAAARDLRAVPPPRPRPATAPRAHRRDQATAPSSTATRRFRSDAPRPAAESPAPGPRYDRWDPSALARGTAVAEPRRTVQIAPRPATLRAQGRSSPRRTGSNPDRLALWAVVLGIFLAIVAAATARGEPDRGPEPAPPPAQVDR